MPYTYRNRNTGDVVERDERSVRLDHLDNWKLIGEPDSAEETDPASTGATPSDPGEVARPVRSASKAAWKAYAIAQGMSEADADKATRDELATHYYEEDEQT